MEKLNKDFILKLSQRKKEPAWMLDFRLKSLEEFFKQDQPNFGPKLNIDFDKILYYNYSICENRLKVYIIKINFSEENNIENFIIIIFYNEV